MVTLFWTLFLLMILGMYLHCNRNQKATSFVININDSISTYNAKCIDEERYSDMLEYHEIYPSFNKIVFSFKRLKYSNFISKENIEKLGLKD